MNPLSNLQLRLHPIQGVAFTSLATEILYGGAAGGGKSFLMRACAITYCLEIRNFQAYFFRRHFDDLIKNHMEGPKGFRNLLSPLVNAGYVEIVGKEIRFPNGSKIYLCHCKDEDDVFQYQGAEIHGLFIDELTHFTEKMYRFLRSRCRCIGVTFPEKYRNKFPLILNGSNPGNVGHEWVKDAWIDSAPPFEIHRAEKSDGGLLRQFIPALLEDNPSATEDDPEYESRLCGLGTDALVKAMREGCWDIIEGAYFPEFSRARHILKPFIIPASWNKIRSFDWGSAKPFCNHWVAISDGDQEKENTSGVFIPRNAFVVYREFYGVKKTSDGKVTKNVGLKMHAPEVADEIARRSLKENYIYSVADTSIFDEDGGPSIAERMARHGVRFRPADKKRIPGWDELRYRLKGDEDGRPLIYFFENCLHTIRTLPLMQYDDTRPEDLDTDLEDHAVDSLRYACMSRPISTTPVVKKQVKLSLKDYTFNEILEEHDNFEAERDIRNLYGF